jgi:hypothetical protein
MHLSRHKLLLMPALMIAANVSAQSVGPSELNASGGSATVGGNTFEYALGSVVATPAFSSASLVITPGVLQPSINGVKVETIAVGSLQVYPTPMDQILHIEPAFRSSGSLEYRLVDAAGKLVLNRTVRLSTGSERQALDVRELAAGNYFLQVSWTGTNAAEQRTAFKLQKLK